MFDYVLYKCVCAKFTLKNVLDEARNEESRLKIMGLA